MRRWIGDVRVDALIPRVVYEREPLENTHDFIRRIARAISFAFAVDLAAADDDPDFDLRSDMLVLPDSLVARTWSRGTLAMSRDRERVEKTGAEQICVFLVEQGTAETTPTHGGHRLTPGDIVVFDLAQPCGIVQHDAQVIRLIFSRAMLPKSVCSKTLNGCVIPANHALSGVIMALAKQLMADSDRMSPQQGTAVLQATLEFLGTALHDVLSRADARPNLATTVQVLIDNNLERRDLTPDWIASQVAVSRATLYRTLRPLGGVREFIVRRRVQRAWALIASSDVPDFTAIARACGFGTRARLSSAFSKRLGVTLEQFAEATPEHRQEIIAYATNDIIGTWEDLTGRRNVVE